MTLIKLVSSAKTGYMRYIFRPRSSPVVTQVRYDPIGKHFEEFLLAAVISVWDANSVKRHVLFTEARKRKVADIKPPIFQ